jgi:tetratricopeptide (TPR) repeat protein
MLYEVQAGNSKAIKKQLNRMLGDFKNSEFRDQIYYALAEIADKENDSPLAISYLNKSIRESVSNKTQKALSYLKRADIYFAATNYKAAEMNYDSAIAILPKDYPNYFLIEGKKKSLTELVLNLNIISVEDSLQRLASMTEANRNTTIGRR